MTHPTNNDLADALREIANSMPLGSALVLRLAADRLGQPVADADGWIEWDASATDSMDGPRLADDTEVLVRFKSGEESDAPRTVRWWRQGINCNNWSHVSPRYSIVAYRVVR